VAGFCRLAGC